LLVAVVVHCCSLAAYVQYVTPFRAGSLEAYSHEPREVCAVDGPERDRAARRRMDGFTEGLLVARGAPSYLAAAR
jgi:hypothetical protein